MTIARLRHEAETVAATNASTVHVGDRISVVGTPAGLEQFERVVGPRTEEDLVLEQSGITFRRVLVTDHNVLGKTVDELDLDDRFGVAVTRLTRADIELTAVPEMRLKFGDRVNIVGGRRTSKKPPPPSAIRLRN